MFARSLAPAATLALAFATPVQAQDRFTNPFGGRGGQQFVIRCDPGKVLTGVSTRQGAYIDYIAPICDGVVIRGAGGAADIRSDATCPGGSVVGKVAMTSLRSTNRLLKYVGLYCYQRGTSRYTAFVSLDSPGRYTRPIDFLARDRRYPTDTFDCGGESIVGLQGRSGASVDALGLICGR